MKIFKRLDPSTLGAILCAFLGCICGVYFPYSPGDKPQTNVAEKKIAIPDDSDKWFVSLFLPDNWEQDTKSVSVVKQFSNSDKQHDLRLVDLKEKTTFQTYHESDAHYQNLFKRACPVLPCIVIQTPDGVVRYKASGLNIPLKQGELSKSIELISKNGWKVPKATEAQQIFFRRRNRCGPDGCPDNRNQRPPIDRKRILPDLDVIPDTILPEPLKKLKKVNDTVNMLGNGGVIVFFLLVAVLLYKFFD